MDAEDGDRARESAMAFSTEAWAERWFEMCSELLSENSPKEFKKTSNSARRRRWTRREEILTRSASEGVIWHARPGALESRMCPPLWATMPCTTAVLPYTLMSLDSLSDMLILISPDS